MSDVEQSRIGEAGRQEVGGGTESASHAVQPGGLLANVAAQAGRPLLQRKLQRRLSRRAAGGAGAEQGGHDESLARGSDGAGADAAAAAKLARTANRVPLPHRKEVEARLDCDLSQIEVYVGVPATRACEMIGAHAFAVGNMIVFADANPDLATVMHEVAHVVHGGGHASGGVSIPERLEMSAPGDASETLADAVEGAASGGALSPEVQNALHASQPQGAPQVSRKPKVTDYCKVKIATDVLDKPGGKKVGALAKGDFVKVKSIVGGAAYEVEELSGKVAGFVAAHTLKELDGVVNGKFVFNQGQPGGTLNADAINCLGHASGSNAATSVGVNALENMLKGLGFSCVVGDHTALKGAIKAKKHVMMVYLYMFRSDWRDTADQSLSFAELAKKYKWTANSWRETNVFVSAAGVRQPIDYHAITLNPSTGKWEYVAHFKPKESDGTYQTDSSPSEAAASDPDQYFPSEQVLVSIACSR